MHMPRMYMHIIIIMTAANFIQRDFLSSKFIVAIISTDFQIVNTKIFIAPIDREKSRITGNK